MGIILVTCRGEVTRNDLDKDRQAISRINREMGIDRVLVDATAAVKAPSELPLYEHGRSLAENGIPRSIRYAILVSRDVEEDVRFLETTSRNRGVDMRVFKSRDEALSWLME
jgi:hypothetical protein